MANQDFLITFSVDGTQALHMMDQIGQRATALEARLNALGRGTGGTAAGGVLKSMGVTPAEVNQSAASIAGLDAKLKSLRASYNQMRDARVATGGTAKGFAFSELGTAMRAEIKATREALAALQAPVSSGAGNVLKTLGTQAQQATQALSGTTQALSGVNAQAGKIPAQVNQSAQAFGGLAAQVARLQAGISARQALGLPVSASQFATAAVATQQLAQNLGTATAAGRQFTQQAANLAGQSKIAAQQLDQTSQAFGRHTQRILEAIIVYEAFGRAIQALQSGIALIIDIDRESRRLEAVLEISPTQSAEFVRGLGQIASDTVTPIHNLVSEADRMGAAFLDVEDPIRRAADTLEFAAAAGKFTTATQRDMGTEVTNLIAIMKQLNIPVAELDDTLGKIVVAGGNSSTIIAGLADALQISSRAAAQAGVDLDVLLGIESAFLIETGRTGSEVGNLFKLLFQRLSDPGVAENVLDITDGLLKMRDATGSIRDPIQIMLELNALLEAGAISATQFRDVLDTMAPPLNPAAKADFILINELLQEIGPRVAEIGQADVSDLDKLVAKINDALGPQFQKLIIDAQLAFVNLFQDDILEAGFDFIDLIRGIGDALGDLPPGVLETIVKFGTFLIALKGITFVLGRLLPLIGLRGMAGAFTTGAATATSLAGGLTGAAGATTLLGRAALIATGFLGGMLAVMAPLLVAVAAYMALDLAGFIGDQQEALKGQIGGNLIGMTADELRAERGRIAGNLSAQGRVDVGLGSVADAFASQGVPDLKEFTTDPALKASIEEINRLLAEMGEGGTVTAEMLAEGFQGAADALTETGKASGSLTSSLDEDKDAARAYAESVATMTEAERNAIASGELFKNLADEKADSLLELNERLKEGAINQAEWAAGQDQVTQAAQISADLVASFGDQLRILIPELGNAAEGNDALASALFEMIIQSTDALPAIQRLAAAALASAQTSSFAAVAAQGASIHFDQMALSAFRGAEGIDAMNRASARAIALQGKISGTISKGGGGIGDLAAIFEQIRNLFASQGSTTFGTGLPPKSSVGSGPGQVPILDIGDLPADQLAKLIALATTLRNSIPGETAASADALVAVVKDAQFLQNIRGIDDRLLRLALEELVEVEKKRLALEEAQLRQGLLSNLVTNVGPLGALISQPTAFGVGGSLALGSGLNIDPNTGNFTINVPIELVGLEPAALQSLIYQTIAQAIQDALRTGGA